MQNEARTAKILVSLVASMTLGALVLMALDNQTLSAGPFSLASYTSLNPVEEVISNLSALPEKWDRVQVYYNPSGDLTDGGNLNCHFVIFNGTDADDGLIQTTEKWHRQRFCLPNKNFHGTGRTIRICIIADGLRAGPTDCQIKRTAALAESLSRKFSIPLQRITYPTTWQL